MHGSSRASRPATTTAGARNTTKTHPHTREEAIAQRVLRPVDDPNEVFVYLEFSSLEDAQEARNRLVASGVLDRFADKHGPNVLTTAT